MSRGEVIGLLGGTFDEENKVLKVNEIKKTAPNVVVFLKKYFNHVRQCAKISVLC